MKIKVLIVDDEKLERILIRKGFDWEANGFEIIGEAESGVEALTIIQEIKPDLVLTDISMVNMDGLDLSEKILKLFPSTHIVVITGYREFEYARRSVKIGVEDFLLKPVSINDLSLVANRVKEKILNEEEANLEVISLKERVLVNQDIVMESFFQKLMEGDVLEDEVNRKLNLYDVHHFLKGFTVINIKPKGKVEDNSRKIIGKIRELVQDEISKEDVCFIHYTHNVVVVHSTKDNIKSYDLANGVHQRIKDELLIGTTIGISQVHEDIQGFSAAFNESDKALGVSVLLGRNRCITYEDYKAIITQNPQEKDIDWDDFIFSVENGLEDKVMDYTKEYVQLIKGAKSTDIEYYRLMTMDMFSKGETTLNKYGEQFNVGDDDKLYREIRAINTVDEMEEFLVENLIKMMEIHLGKKGKRVRKVVEDALLYVDQEIFSQELSLKTVAASIFSNESYLSRVFKKDMGVSLIEYILKRRIEESINLLNTTDLKVYEIAEKIGFRDSHYFSICFKKNTGLTVKEFRKMKPTI